MASEARTIRQSVSDLVEFNPQRVFDPYQLRWPVVAFLRSDEGEQLLASETLRKTICRVYHVCGLDLGYQKSV